MGALITGLVEAPALMIAAASSASRAINELIEAHLDGTDAAYTLRHHETAEGLADALQSVLWVELEDEECPAERREAAGQLLAAVSRFLEGWA